METGKRFKHIGFIGAGPGISVLEKYLRVTRKHSDPAWIKFNPPAFSEEKKQKMLQSLNDCVGRTMLIIEQPEIEFIPYISPKRARFLKYGSPNKKQYQVRTKK